MKKPNYLLGLNVGNQEVERACNAILANDEYQMPIVGEDVFINQIIPLLQRPWDERNLALYKRYVRELTLPLRVAGVRDGETTVLFTVPPLHARVDTSSASIHDITVGHLIEHVDLLRNRGTHEPVEEYVKEYLHQISQLKPAKDKLLVPIGAILAVYGKTFIDDGGFPLYSLDGSVTEVSGSSGNLPLDENPFESDGLLDED